MIDAAQIFRAHEREIVGIAWRILRSIEDARDVAQDAFVKLVAAARDGTSIANARAWLRRVTINLSINRLRARPAPSPTQAAPAPADDRRAVLERALSVLPERQRVVFLLRHEQGLPLVEIAEALGIAPSTAGVHLTRALDALRRALAPHLEDLR